MPDRRTITITLTGPQFDALASAVAATEVDDTVTATERATLERAWQKIRKAWWGLR